MDDDSDGGTSVQDGTMREEINRAVRSILERMNKYKNDVEINLLRLFENEKGKGTDVTWNAKKK